MEIKRDTEADVIQRMGGAFLGHGRFALVLTDPNQPDNPITYVNRGFERMTGYSREAAVGRNCRFLQGDDHDQPQLQELREGIAKRIATSVEVRNYKASGEMFVNRLLIAPVEDEAGHLIAYVGIQTEVDPGRSAHTSMVEHQNTIDHLELLLHEANQRVKTHLRLLTDMIRGAKPDPSALSAELLSHRVEALSLLYEDLSPTTRAGDQPETVSAGEYLSKVAATLSTIDPTQGVRFNVDTDYCLMGVDRAALLGLITSEIISVMLTYVDAARADNLIDVNLSEVSGNRVEVRVESSFPLGEDCALPESSSAIIHGLAKQLGAEVTLGEHGEGCALRLDFGAIH